MGQAQQAAAAFENERAASNESRSTSKTLLERLASRQSEEIVIAFAGPVGCGLEDVLDATEQSLIGLGYQVVWLKLSACLESALSSGHLVVGSPAGSPSFVRSRRLQAAALRMREASGDLHVLAEFAVERVVVERSRAAISDSDVRSGAFIPLRDSAPGKVLPEYMDNYTEFETAASTHFQKAYRHACNGRAPQVVQPRGEAT